MDVKLTTTEHVKLLFSSPDVYAMTSPRGRVLLINNDEFDSAVCVDQFACDDREGSEYDRDKLQKLFEALDFIVTVRNNLSRQRLLDAIEIETHSKDHIKYGMFVLIILSHGMEQVVFGSDGRKVTFGDINRRLSARNFPAMENKPKWIIIQACAGSGHDVESVKTDKVTQGPSAPAPQPSSLAKSSVVDFLILQSSYPGYVSLRHSEEGTFMIQALVKVLCEHACHENLNEVVVRVRKEVLELCQKNSGNYGAQTVFCSESLLKKIYLFPGMKAPAATPARQLSKAERAERTRSWADLKKVAEPEPGFLPNFRFEELQNPVVLTRSVSTATGNDVTDGEMPESGHWDRLQNEHSEMKFTLVKTLKTSGWCATVLHLADGSLVHGGDKYIHIDDQIISLPGITRHIAAHKDLLYTLTMVDSTMNVHIVNTKTKAIRSSIINYRSASYFATLCVTSEYIMISDENKKCIHVFSRYNNTHLFDFTSSYLKYPSGITTLNDGRVVICDSGKQTVGCYKKIEPDARPEWTVKGMKHVYSVTVEPSNGIIYAAVLHKNTIYMLSTKGERLAKVEVKGGAWISDMSIHDDNLTLARVGAGVEIYSISQAT